MTLHQKTFKNVEAWNDFVKTQLNRNGKRIILVSVLKTEDKSIILTSLEFFYYVQNGQCGLKYKIMLGEQVEQKLKELRELCQLGASKETVHILFHLNSYGWNTEIQERTADSLKNEGITMRNLKGDFVKQY